MTDVSNHSMKRITVILMVLIISFYLGVSPLDAAAASEGTLHAGTARIDITPEKPVKMSGYGARTALSEAVHDPLSARVVAFENNGKRLVLVSSDLLGFYDGTAEHFRKVILSELELKPGELFLSAIHTHDGPTLTMDGKKGMRTISNIPMLWKLNWSKSSAKR